MVELDQNMGGNTSHDYNKVNHVTLHVNYMYHVPVAAAAVRREWLGGPDKVNIKGLTILEFYKPGGGASGNMAEKSFLNTKVL